MSIKHILFACCSISVLFAGSACAQVAVSTGVECGFPFFVNRQGYYNLESFGLRTDVSYQPRNTTLYPSASFLLTYMQLPVYASNYSGLNVFASNRSLMLNLNCKSDRENNNFLIYGGLGVAQIQPNGNVYNTNSTDLQLVSLYNINLYPAINAGCKFYHRLPVRRPIYVTFEANLTYIRMYANDNEYYIQSYNARQKVSIYGDILFPGAVFSMCYIFERRE